MKPNNIKIKGPCKKAFYWPCLILLPDILAFTVVTAESAIP
jgi:hypothetical protein